jgi:hypothetical protein
MRHEYKIVEYVPEVGDAVVTAVAFLNTMSTEGWEYVEGMSGLSREVTVADEAGRRVLKCYRDVLFRRPVP